MEPYWTQTSSEPVSNKTAAKLIDKFITSTMVDSLSRSQRPVSEDLRVMSESVKRAANRDKKQIQKRRSKKRMLSAM